MTQSRERGEPEPPPVVARVGYNPGARVMEITFDPASTGSGSSKCA